jgi:hypothetical protein
MTRDEFLRREAEGRPIMGFRELTFALMELQRRRVPERSERWYKMNRWIRECMELADREEERSL